jgi:hypothetical protein
VGGGRVRVGNLSCYYVFQTGFEDLNKLLPYLKVLRIARELLISYFSVYLSELTPYYVSHFSTYLECLLLRCYQIPMTYFVRG